ncbi:MAG: HepT-like ribonuclease domain-containing protein [Methanomicrobiales archaeon]
MKHDDYFAHAVRNAIGVIGEAAKNVPDQVKNGHQEIPWRDMAGLRDRIIHGYFRIDYSIVWNVITDELPKLEPKISALLDELDTVSDTHHPAHKKP